jgi:hypothetical protein
MEALFKKMTFIVLLSLSLSEPGLAESSSQIISDYSQFRCRHELLCIKEFRDKAALIPKSLIEAGISSLGELNLVDLIKILYTTNVIPRAWISYPDGEGYERISAIWHRNGDVPFLEYNLPAWEGTPDQTQPLVGLHEILGLAKVDDKDFNLSTALWLLLEIKKRELKIPEVEEWLREDAIQLAKGGAVGVGGGGDLNIAGVKQTILQLALDTIPSPRKGEPTSEQKANLLREYRIMKALSFKMAYPKRER